MIQDFYNKLSDQEKKVFYAAIIALVLSFFDMLFLRPVLSRLSTIDEQLQETRSSIEKDIRFIAYENKIMKEDDAFQVFETDENKTGEEIIASFLKTVETLSSESSITLVKLNPSEVTSKKGFFLYSAAWEGYGSLSNMIDFMYRVDTTDNLLKIVKFNMEADRASKENVKASMKIVKLIIDPSTIGNFEFEKDDMNMPKTYADALDVIRSPEAFESATQKKSKASAKKGEASSSAVSDQEGGAVGADGAGAGGVPVGREGAAGKGNDSKAGGNAGIPGIGGEKDNDLYLGEREKDRQADENEGKLAPSTEKLEKNKKSNALSKSLDKVGEGGRVRIDSLDTLWSSFMNKFFKKGGDDQEEDYQPAEYDQNTGDGEDEGNLWERKINR